ncbi:MAG TPA: heparinase II/III family protein, partial [Xanthobacteraceae bacterium]
GEDLFVPAKGEALPSKVADEFAIRFHLNPLVRASRGADGHGVVLTLPNKDGWHFHAADDAVDIEDGVHLGGQDGPRRGSFIVIRGHARQAPRVRWSFQLMQGARRTRGGEPELPL